MQGKEKVVCAAFALGLIALLVPLVFMRWGLLDLRERRKELAELQTVSRTIVRENRELEVEIRRLKSDPVYLEYVARRELGMVADDEIVVKFHGKDGTE